jgi:hypothetical protein
LIFINHSLHVVTAISSNDYHQLFSFLISSDFKKRFLVTVGRKRIGRHMSRHLLGRSGGRRGWSWRRLLSRARWHCSLLSARERQCRAQRESEDKSRDRKDERQFPHLPPFCRIRRCWRVCRKLTSFSRLRFNFPVHALESQTPISMPPLPMMRSHGATPYLSRLKRLRLSEFVSDLLLWSGTKCRIKHSIPLQRHRPQDRPWSAAIVQENLPQSFRRQARSVTQGLELRPDDSGVHLGAVGCL